MTGHPSHKAALLAGALAVGLLSGCAPKDAGLRTAAGVAQGTTYSLQWTGGTADRETIAHAAQAELDRLDALLSNYRPDSVIERFNTAQTLAAQAVPRELVDLLRIAKEIHAASAGCFDPTVRPLVHLWGFDGDEPSVPAMAAIVAARAAVGLDKLEIVDDEHLRKTVPALAIDMSSIGQGYAAERLGRVLEQYGVSDYLAEIGGEIFARGAKPDGKPWRVGVESPDGGVGPAFRLPAEPGTAVTTSGTYEHFFEADGHRYSHILDPRTGMPVDHALAAVTVVARDGARAGAWGTALTCLGPQAAADAADREHVAALLAVRVSPEHVEERRTSALADSWPGLLD